MPSTTAETDVASRRSRAGKFRHRILEIISPVAGFAGSMIVLLVIVVLVGESPGKALDAIYRFCFGNAGRRASLFFTPRSLSRTVRCEQRPADCRSS